MAPLRIRARAARATAKSVRGRYPASSNVTSDIHGEPIALQSASSILKRKRDEEENTSTDWRLNKRDKRTIKHNALLARVRDAGVQKKPLKRRRPGKKLRTDIGSLADALPDTNEAEDEGDAWQGISDNEIFEGNAAMSEEARNRKRKARRKDIPGKMEMKSLRHRPGAMKRKMAMEGREMERFQKNLAQMVSSAQSRSLDDVSAAQRQSNEQCGPSQADRWAALRSFIGSTMQKDKAFTTT